MRFEGHSEAKTGWDGVGTGTVMVAEPIVGVLTFEESGMWHPRAADTSPVEFKNVFRWSDINGVLRLEHLRFGVDHPVVLFDMVPDEYGVWRAQSPHQCGEDCYSASLMRGDENIVMAWSIMGPRKQEAIRYRYW